MKILIDLKSYEKILFYNFSCKTLIGDKPLRISFDKTDRFIKVYDGNRYLVLLGDEEYESIYNRIRDLIGVKSDIRNVISPNYARIEFDLYNSSYKKKH